AGGRLCRQGEQRLRQRDQFQRHAYRPDCAARHHHAAGEPDRVRRGHGNLQRERQRFAAFQLSMDFQWKQHFRRNRFLAHAQQRPTVPGGRLRRQGKQLLRLGHQLQCDAYRAIHSAFDHHAAGEHKRRCRHHGDFQRDRRRLTAAQLSMALPGHKHFPRDQQPADALERATFPGGGILGAGEQPVRLNHQLERHTHGCCSAALDHWPAGQIVLAGGAALFSVSATGALPLSYQWRFNGATISGATFPTLNLSGVTTNQAGAYSVRITNAFGSVISSNATLTVVPVPGYTNLHSFVGNIAANPQAPFLVSSNTLYGTTAGGGSGGWGAVYKMGTNGSSKTTLHNFSGPDGMTPVGSLLLSGSTLYGATSAGGANGSGTIFKVNTDGSGFATLYSFSLDDTGTNSDGAEPNGGLVISGSTLYGTTGVAGPLGWGTLFKISTNGTGFAIVHTFTSGSDGSNPNGGLVLSGSTLYGAAGTGGANNVGTIFKVKTDGTGFTTVHTFSSPTGGNPINTEGYNPQGNLLLSGNTLYGTTPIGGANGEGTIYSVQTNGSGLTVVHTFTAPNPFTNADGAIPSPGLVLTGGKLYGTAQQAGFNAGGTIFSVKTNGSSFTTIYNFSLPNGNAFGAATNSDGLTPLAGLALSGSTLF